VNQNSSVVINIPSAGEEIPHLSWTPKVNYDVCKGPPLDTVFGQMNAVYTTTPLI
jgi:hypothetical protein